jgi:hypothetical protein
MDGPADAMPGCTGRAWREDELARPHLPYVNVCVAGYGTRVRLDASLRHARVSRARRHEPAWRAMGGLLARAGSCPGRTREAWCGYARQSPPPTFPDRRGLPADASAQNMGPRPCQTGGQTPPSADGPQRVGPHARPGWAPAWAGPAGSAADAGAAAGRSSRPRTRPVHLDPAAAGSGPSVPPRSPRRRRPAAAWERARPAGARVGGEVPPASGGRWPPSCSPRGPPRGAGAPVRGHPTGSGDDPAEPAVRRPGARRGSPPLGAKPPWAPRPGASERPSRRWARPRLAPWRTTGRCTPTACATADGEDPAASRRISFPRRASPAAMVVARGHPARVGCSARDRTMGHADLRPRAIALACPCSGAREGTDPGTRPSSQANLHSLS